MFTSHDVYNVSHYDDSYRYPSFKDLTDSAFGRFYDDFTYPLAHFYCVFNRRIVAIRKKHDAFVVFTFAGDDFSVRVVHDLFTGSLEDCRLFMVKYLCSFLGSFDKEF